MRCTLPHHSRATARQLSTYAATSSAELRCMITPHASAAEGV